VRDRAVGAVRAGWMLLCLCVRIFLGGMRWIIRWWWKRDMSIARVADRLIVFHSRGRFVTSVLGIEARCNPRPFCLCLGSRAYIPLLHVIVCSHMGTHVLLARRRLPENKKEQKCEAAHDSSRAQIFFCVLHSFCCWRTHRQRTTESGFTPLPAIEHV
jgi:hypothetical protein